MELISISEDVLVNPQRISVVEVVKKKSGTSLRVTVDDRTFTVDKPVKELFAEMNKAGVDLSEQFFAG